MECKLLKYKGAIFRAAVFAFLALFAAPGRAEPGDPGLLLLRAGGAASAGMSGALAADTGAVDKMSRNPVVVAEAAQHTVESLGTHAVLPSEARVMQAGAATGMGTSGGIGLSVARLGIGGLQARDALDRPAGEVPYSETSLTLAAAYRPGRHDRPFSWGAGINVLSRTLGGSRDHLFGLGVGFARTVLGGRLRAAGAIQNLVAGASGDTEDALPRSGTIGAAYCISEGFVAAGDISTALEFSVGLQYPLGPAALRAGLNEAGGFSLGGGLKARKILVDFSVENHPHLGIHHRVSVGHQFAIRPRKSVDLGRKLSERPKNGHYLRGNDGLPRNFDYLKSPSATGRITHDEH